MICKLQRFFQQLLLTLGPFILLGIAIAFIIGVFILSWYILLLGLTIGFCLWLYTLVKRYFFQKRSLQKNHKGRVIDHDKNK